MMNLEQYDIERELENQEEICDLCEGTGFVWENTEFDEPCNKCNGKGLLKENV